MEVKLTIDDPNIQPQQEDGFLEEVIASIQDIAQSYTGEVEPRVTYHVCDC